MSSIARSSSAGHAAHGFAKAVAKGEPAGEGFEALIASLAGAIVAPPAQNPREGHADAEGEAGDQRGKSGTVDAALTAALAGVGASNPQDNSPAVLLREMHDAHGIATSPALPIVRAANRSDTNPMASRAAAAPTDANASSTSIDATRSPIPGLPAHVAKPAQDFRALSRDIAPNDREPDHGDIAQATIATRAPAHAAIDLVRDARVRVSDEVGTTLVDLAEPKRDIGRSAMPSRAAVDIARQRQRSMASGAVDALDPASGDEVPDPSASFTTLIALRKADGSLPNAPSAHVTDDASAPLPSGAWSATSQGASANVSAATGIAAPRVFDQAAWSEALARQVAAAAVAEARETSVHLEPEGLGPIEVRVRIDAERVDVRFAIEHPVTVNMVRSALPDLERMLAQNGMTLGEANVAQQNAGGREQQASREAMSASRQRVESSAAVSAATPVSARQRIGLLDDFV